MLIFIIINILHMCLSHLQSLLCGPLSVGFVLPLLERLSDETMWGFSLHLLCETRRGRYDSSIGTLLDRCPQAIIAYANHHLQDKHLVIYLHLQESYLNYYLHLWT